jgi:hypothetical protein
MKKPPTEGIRVITPGVRCRVDNSLHHLQSALPVPDVWVEPKFVVMVLADEITRLPVHTASAGGKRTGQCRA